MLQTFQHVTIIIFGVEMCGLREKVSPPTHCILTPIMKAAFYPETWTQQFTSITYLENVCDSTLDGSEQTARKPNFICWGEGKGCFVIILCLLRKKFHLTSVEKYGPVDTEQQSKIKFVLLNSQLFLCLS